jgi:hypothetical protein
MTQGVLIFAFNNSEVDYVELSIYAAKRVKRFLNKPVSLVTDSSEWLYKTFPNDVDVFDKIIESVDTTTQVKKFYDGADSYSNLVWKNSNRANCFYLSPYDETLVIDSDFIINSSFLEYCWDQNHNFLIYNKYNDLASWRNTSEFDYINQFSIPFYWATVFFFRKNSTTEHFFTLIEHIKDNWVYYAKLYRVPSTRYRNDIAFSIAIHMMNGFTSGDFAMPIANKLSYILDRDILISATDNKMTLLVNKENTVDQYTAISTNSLDVHVMNKQSLLRVIRNV